MAEMNYEMNDENGMVFFFQGRETRAFKTRLY